MQFAILFIWISKDINRQKVKRDPQKIKEAFLILLEHNWLDIILEGRKYPGKSSRLYISYVLYALLDLLGLTCLQGIWELSWVLPHKCVFCIQSKIIFKVKGGAFNDYTVTIHLNRNNVWWVRMYSRAKLEQITSGSHHLVMTSTCPAVALSWASLLTLRCKNCGLSLCPSRCKLEVWENEYCGGNLWWMGHRS